jgi:HtrA serine peptidase 2
MFSSLRATSLIRNHGSQFRSSFVRVARAPMSSSSVQAFQKKVFHQHGQFSNSFRFMLALLAATGTSIGFIALNNKPIPIAYNEALNPIDGANKQRTPHLPLSSNFVADAVEIISPAVVNIVAGGGFSRSAGSGFIVSRHGYIVTNAHVVQFANDGQVMITFWDGRKKMGTVHAVDPRSDIAIIKLVGMESEDIPVAKLGSSSALRVGEFVVALGSPMNLLNTVTFGIVSAAARHASELDMSANRNEYIQTDAAINSGNSGGPLVNIHGEVIGINTMKLDRTTGISFAIPMDSASLIIRQLIQNRRGVRPYLGLQIGAFLFGKNTPSKSRAFDYAGEDLIIAVTGVVSESPAAAAGLEP